MNQVVPTVRPYPLPRLAASSVAAYNALARYGKQLDWPAMDGRDGRWRLSIGLPRGADADIAPALTSTAAAAETDATVPLLTQIADAQGGPALWLRTDGAWLRLAIPHAALAAWLASAYPGVGRVDLDQCGWATDAAVECLIEFLRPRLRTLGLPAGWQLTRDDEQAPSSADVAWRGTVLLATPDAEDAWTLALQADAGGLALLARCLPRQAVTGADICLDDVPIPLRAMVGYTDLTYGDVHRLHVGDVVLLDQELGGSRGEICLRAPDGRALKLAAVTPDVAGDRAGMPAPYLIVADWISIMSPEEKEHYPEDDGSLDFDTSDVDDDDADYSGHDYDDEDEDDEDDEDDYGSSDDGAGAHDENDADRLPVAGGDDGYAADLDAAQRQATEALAALAPLAAIAPGTQTAFGDLAPSSDSMGKADTAGSEALDAIPMRVGFDLGARAMPLGDVRRLRQGQTVVLDCEAATAPVSIRANGLCIGHGELVEIDGRLGVRIVSLRQKRV